MADYLSISDNVKGRTNEKNVIFHMTYVIYVIYMCNILYFGTKLE